MNLAQAIEERFSLGDSVRQAYDALRPHYPELTLDQVREAYRRRFLLQRESERLGELLESGESDHVMLVRNFFRRVAQLDQEANFANLLSQEIRAALSEQIAQGGLEGIDDKILGKWLSIVDRVEKLSGKSIEHLRAYREMLAELLALQKQNALIRVLMDALASLDPHKAKELQARLGKDPLFRVLVQELNLPALRRLALAEQPEPSGALPDGTPRGGP